MSARTNDCHAADAARQLHAQTAHLEMASSCGLVTLRVRKHESRVELGAPHQVNRAGMFLVCLPAEPCNDPATLQ
jgi:hypothetical protein